MNIFDVVYFILAVVLAVIYVLACLWIIFGVAFSGDRGDGGSIDDEEQ